MSFLIHPPGRGVAPHREPNRPAAAADEFAYDHPADLTDARTTSPNTVGGINSQPECGSIQINQAEFERGCALLWFQAELEQAGSIRLSQYGVVPPAIACDEVIRLGGAPRAGLVLMKS
jgi:hypothetical protein